MFSCFSKRVLSGIDDSFPVFSLNRYEGYAKITSVYDGDTFRAAIIKHGRVLKFTFRTLGYDSPEMKPLMSTSRRNDHIYVAKLARDVFKQECGFDDRAPFERWNPFLCKNKVNGLVWIKCDKNDKYGRTLVTVYRYKGDTVSVNEKMLSSGLVNAYDGRTKPKFHIRI